MNELGNTPADKNYKSSGISKVESRVLEAYPRDEDRELNYRRANYRIAYERGYEQATQDIIALIESRLSEIIGDAQPKPAMRMELKELITRIKKEEK